MDTLTELGERVIEVEKQRDRLKDDVLAWAVTCKNLEHENKALRLQANTYFDEWQEAKKENEQLNEQINKSDHTIATLFLEREELKQDYKNKIDDMKKLSDEVTQLNKELEDREQSHIDLYCDNEQFKRKAQTYDKMMTGEMGELYKKAEAWCRIKEDVKKWYEREMKESSNLIGQQYVRGFLVLMDMTNDEEDGLDLIQSLPNDLEDE